MLTGQNGILNRASEAKEKTETANKYEQRKLAQAEALMSTEDIEYNGVTIPKGFVPTKIVGEDSVDAEIVIIDGSGNEYVWVEVPKTIYKDSNYNTNGEPSSSTDYSKIEACLKAYTSDYSDASYSDTNPSFTILYQNMLKSVYKNGGFWIGRYEAGLEEGKNPRTSYVAIAENDKAVTKPNMYPYNWVRCGEAQTLAERMNYDGVTSSLIYGLQWDLVLKFIETKKATAKDNLTTNSTAIGNYKNNLWNITNSKARYSINDGKSFTVGQKRKSEESAILLTTGADTSFSLMNIYDIAGNVLEWTREFCNASGPCVFRGGSYSNIGSNSPAKDRIGSTTSDSTYNLGFRLGLWK